VAYLGEQPITLAEVYFHLGRRPGFDEDSDAMLSANPLPFSTMQNAIALMALQRQALQSLRKLKLVASKDEVDRWIETHDSLPVQNQSAAEIAERLAEEFRIRREVYFDRVDFRLSWQRYLAKHLTPANLARHFESQKSRFDGTRFKVWMLSIPLPAGQGRQRELAVRKLSSLAESLSGDADVTERQLEELAASDGLELTRESWVRGMGDVDTQIVDALLETEVGQLTSIIHNATGVHVARLLKRDLGDQTLSQVQDEVRLHMLEYLLRYLASQSEQQMPLRAVEGA
jgi:hypothetical protein